ncbi:hypothetical protein QZH41_020514 [Actinostola sp. cb2023]|nr:hypothetical protein QZH41_020514 [Actinostola sp. cb2023]
MTCRPTRLFPTLVPSAKISYSFGKTKLSTCNLGVVHIEVIPMKALENIARPDIIIRTSNYAPSAVLNFLESIAQAFTTSIPNRSTADNIQLEPGTTGSDVAGIVRVYHNAQWGTVCHTNWDMDEAKVALCMSTTWFYQSCRILELRTRVGKSLAERHAVFRFRDLTS